MKRFYVVLQEQSLVTAFVAHGAFKDDDVAVTSLRGLQGGFPDGQYFGETTATRNPLHPA